MWLLMGAVPYLAVLLGMYVLSSAWFAILAYHLMMLASFLILGNEPGLLLKGFNVRTVAPLSLAFSAGILSLYFLWPFLGGELDTALIRLGLDPFWPFALYFPIVNPFLEEVYWRHLISQRIHIQWIGDLLFGGYHGLVLAFFVPWYFCVAASLCLALIATVLRNQVKSNGSLIPAIAVHTSTDFAVVISVYLIIFFSR